MANPQLPLAGKIAIVTGASRGIGKGIAIELARRGARGITITYASNVEAANATISEIQALGAKAIAIKSSDVLDNAFADNLVKSTLQAFDSETIDILVNNAAVIGLSPLGFITPQDFYKVYDCNALAPYLLIQSVLPVIARGGSIINISSCAARAVGGYDPYLGAGLTLYSSSKAALEHMTRNLAAAYAKEKLITTNVVAPGGIATDGITEMPPEMRRRVEESATAETRLGTVEECADVVAWLAGPGGARWINGDTIQVSGGTAMF